MVAVQMPHTWLDRPRLVYSRYEIFSSIVLQRPCHACLQVMQEKVTHEGHIGQLQGIKAQLEATIRGHEEYQSQIEGKLSSLLLTIGSDAISYAEWMPTLPIRCLHSAALHQSSS